jgi:amidase
MALLEQDWQEVAAVKRADLLSSIPHDWVIPRDILPADNVLDVTVFRRTSGMLTAKEIRITDTGAVDIVEKISKRLWSAEEVALAFCKAAAIAHQLVDPKLECP